jgi:arsenate reductase-like glutaredoxin family protein
MRPILLYKVHGLPNCDSLQHITRYLHSNGFDMRPKTIIERNFPANITVLPTLVLEDNVFLEGLNQIINYYEQHFNINNLLLRSNTFKELNPDYKITEKFTQKNTIHI